MYGNTELKYRSVILQDFECLTNTAEKMGKHELLTYVNIIAYLPMGRKRHPNKEIEEAVQYAENKGWLYRKPGRSSHTWGRLFCPERSRDGCQISVWTTPKNIENHARQIHQTVNRCPHGKSK